MTHKHFSWNFAIFSLHNLTSFRGLSTITWFLALFLLGAPKRGSAVDEASGQRERGLDSTIGSLCAVDNDLINESISTEARPCLATLDLSQPHFPARGKSLFWIPSALLLIRSIPCHRARKSDLHQRTFIGVCSTLGQHLLAARKKVNTFIL